MGSKATARAGDSNVSVLDPLANQARSMLRALADAVAHMEPRIDASFGRAVRLFAQLSGHVVVMGVGKSGLVGQKVASTFASTGTPSFFVHASEAFHGDLGMITEEDAVLMVCGCAERTDELTQLVPHLRRRGIPTVAIIGNTNSLLAREADIVLDAAVPERDGPAGLGPAGSTLALLAMGDALAVSLTRHRGFHEEDFARLHPGGNLGRRLSRVGDVMARPPMPVVRFGTPLRDCILALANAALPYALVLEGTRLSGVIGERELRDAMDDLACPVESVMSTELPTVSAHALVSEAEELLTSSRYDTLIVLDDDQQVCGTFSRVAE